MKRFTEEFYCLLQYIGWGDPNGGLWTMGIEEAEEWIKDEEISNLDLVRKKIKENFCKEYEPVPNQQKITKEEKAKKKKNDQVRDVSAKIACGISASCRDWQRHWMDYKKDRLWKKGSKVFNGNLYPLGRKSLKKSFQHFTQSYLD